MDAFICTACGTQYAPSDKPPAQWNLERRREYFDWARRVIDGLRGAHPGLEAVFDAAYAARP